MPKFILYLLITISYFFSCSTNLALAEKDLEAGLYKKGLVSVDPTAGLERNEHVSVLESSLCQVILIINGRVGRAIAAMSLILLAYQFFLGKAQWSLVAIMCIGFGLMFGARGVALALLPTRVYVRDYDRQEYKIKTSDELVRTSCPELR